LLIACENPNNVTTPDAKTPSEAEKEPENERIYKSANIGTLKYINPGKFQYDKTTTNIAEITKPYRIGEKEITRAQFKAIMGADPSTLNYNTNMDDYPVEHVSFYAAIIFCNKLSIKEGLTPVYSIEGFDFGAYEYEEKDAVDLKTYWEKTLNKQELICDWEANGYRLPTNMEWTWAAMGARVDAANPDAIDTTSWNKWYAGDDLSDMYMINIPNFAVVNTLSKPSNMAKVGSIFSNEADLYDMSGNAFEWVWDKAGTLTGNITDWKGSPSSGVTSPRLIRGGDFSSPQNLVGLATSFVESPPWTAFTEDTRLTLKAKWVGFRVARN
ncbi:MAG TPA: SUMF1/EgtB/PvdO family nonheme iron enzyme, partial [Treponemataceae bacterium]|nr:SUMF1/EgtB/PvdO family nonheme iron enzyme [Treponemataceae bacterium]